MKVLVGYASAHGSTAEIAHRLGERLRRHGLDVEVRDLGLVDPARYDAFVLGSAIHNQRWMPLARSFMVENAAELTAKPVWLFSVGMPGALRRPLRLLAGLQPAAVAAEFIEQVSFRDHRVFTGVVRDDHLAWPGRLLMRLFTTGPGDYRDWAAVERWGDGIARVLAVLAPAG
jgi:menaquinone-dependent protoporphyrinogen oxidase